MTAVELLAEKLQEEIKYGASISDIIDTLTKWQQEQDKKMYSEIEVLDILYKHTEDLLAGKKLTLEQWFEQFKKK